ncbi:hypothetical protein Taro_016198 [Colocasia esculenta]|uniref:Uncharacterized protein n=1 Tax=Colocasia esculenta TaxID=4460 RepID=A0A843UJP2_COLES|nr:hypothetical protein [Colocasia esculenta]
MSSTGATKGGRGKPKASKAVSRSQKAGLCVGASRKCNEGQQEEQDRATAHPARGEERRGAMEATGTMTITSDEVLPNIH